MARPSYSLSWLEPAQTLYAPTWGVAIDYQMASGNWLSGHKLNCTARGAGIFGHCSSHLPSALSGEAPNYPLSLLRSLEQAWALPCSKDSLCLSNTPALLQSLRFAILPLWAANLAGGHYHYSQRLPSTMNSSHRILGANLRALLVSWKRNRFQVKLLPKTLHRHNGWELGFSHGLLD